MKLFRTVYLSLGILLLMQCGAEPKAKKDQGCDAPKPAAIFSDKFDKIKTHSFSGKGQEAEEQLSFEDGSELVLFQGGCEKIVQEFRFKVPNAHAVAKTSLAIDRMGYLAQIDPEFLAFGHWSDAIAQLADRFAQEEAVEVEPGFFVAIDKIDSQDRSTLIVKLFQQ